MLEECLYCVRRSASAQWADHNLPQAPPQEEARGKIKERFAPSAYATCVGQGHETHLAQSVAAGCELLSSYV